MIILAKNLEYAWEDFEDEGALLTHLTSKMFIQLLVLNIIFGSQIDSSISSPSVTHDYWLIFTNIETKF